MLVNIGRFLFDQILQNELINLSTDQTDVVIIVQMEFGDRDEQPKRVFRFEKEQRHGNDEIHSLTVADRRVVQAEHLQHLP